MNQFVALLVPFAIALAAAPSRAQSDCPNLGTIIAPATVVYGPISSCGVGLEIELAGVHYTAKQGKCPAWSAYTPERGVPAVMRIGYFYRATAPTFTIVQNYSCTGWFWTECTRSGGPMPVGPVPNYVDVPCAGTHAG